MKRFLCVLLSAVLLFSALSVTAFAAEKDRAATKKILARFDAFDADSPAFRKRALTHALL